MAATALKIDVHATDDELIAKADVLIAHIEDLRDAAEARCACHDSLSKAAQLQIKAHPKVALTQLRRQWVTGYRDQMQSMLAEVDRYLQGIAPASGQSADSASSALPATTAASLP